MVYYVPQGKKLRQKRSTTHLFLAEGNSEVGFLDKYLQRINASVNTTTVVCYEGKDNLPEVITKALRVAFGDLDRMKGLGIMCDGEEDPHVRLSTIIKCAQNFDFPNCTKDFKQTGIHMHGTRAAGVSLSPKLNTVGRIEDLVLLEIQQHPLATPLAMFCNSITQHSGAPVDQKAKVQMFISARINSGKCGIIRGFEADIFDPMHPAYALHRAMVDHVMTGR